MLNVEWKMLNGDRGQRVRRLSVPFLIQHSTFAIQHCLSPTSPSDPNLTVLTLIRISPQLLRHRHMLLLIQPALFGGAGGARLLPRGTNDQSFAQQFLHTVEGMVAVGHLTARGLGGHAQYAGAADAACQ